MAPNYTDASTVISLLPIPLIERKPGLQPGEYCIPAATNGKPGILNVVRAQFPVYIDENRPALIVPEPSDNVAESICRDYKVASDFYQPGLSEPGLFWVKEAWKLNDVISGRNEMITVMLKEAAEKQHNWFKLQVEKADDLWGQYRMRRMISDIQRLAAVALGVERDWNLDTFIEKALSVCKFCRSAVAKEAIICPQCHGVLDVDAYKRDFISINQMLQTADPLKQVDPNLSKMGL